MPESSDPLLRIVYRAASFGGGAAWAAQRVPLAYKTKLILCCSFSDSLICVIDGFLRSLFCVAPKSLTAPHLGSHTAERC